MKAILIEEARFADLVELLKAKSEEVRLRHPAEREYLNGVDDAFRALNYVLVTWAQSHGASCIR